VFADLMMRGVEEEQGRKSRAQAIARLLLRRGGKRLGSADAIRAVREELRS